VFIPVVVYSVEEVEVDFRLGFVETDSFGCPVGLELNPPLYVLDSHHLGNLPRIFGGVESVIVALEGFDYLVVVDLNVSRLAVLHVHAHVIRLGARHKLLVGQGWNGPFKFIGCFQVQAARADQLQCGLLENRVYQRIALGIWRFVALRKLIHLLLVFHLNGSIRKIKRDVHQFVVFGQ